MVPILPSVTGPPSDKTQEDREALARRIVAGYDFRQIDRRPGDARPAADVVAEWAAQWIKKK